MKVNQRLSPSDVSAVVCTRNSIGSVGACLESLRDSGLGEVIVVDASSCDGTREVADSLADVVLTDAGDGLGAARNLGIRRTTKPLILNMGSDNILPAEQLPRMIHCLVQGSFAGVSARTVITGSSFGSHGLNLWREGRFPPGPAKVIGTPSLFIGAVLRDHPYDPTRRYSDDSELCERWARQFGSRFSISDAYVYEIGKTSWKEVRIRAAMYGESDYEVFTHGVRSGWNLRRRVNSVLHPLRVDLVEPLSRLTFTKGLRALPFLSIFVLLRYLSWTRQVVRLSS